MAYLIRYMNFKVTKQAQDLRVWIKSTASVLPVGGDNISHESKLYSFTSTQISLTLIAVMLQNAVHEAVRNPCHSSII